MDGGWAANVGLGPGRRERGRAEPEEPVARGLEPLGEPGRGLLRAPVLGEAPRELLGGHLRLELGELGVLVGEQPARLQLEQRRDQDEELAARVEVELIPLGQVLDEGDHDLGEVDLAQRQLLAEDERQQEVERAFERVEIEVELSDRGRRCHPRQASPATGRGPSGRPSSAAAGSGCGRGLAFGGALAARAAASEQLPPDEERRSSRRRGRPRPRR